MMIAKLTAKNDIIKKMMMITKSLNNYELISFGDSYYLVKKNTN